MQDILRATNLEDNRASPWILLITLLGYSLAAAIAFNYLGLFFIKLFYGVEQAEFLALYDDPTGHAQAWPALMTVQATASIGLFILTPLLVIAFHLKLPVGEFFRIRQTNPRAIFMSLAIVFCFMVGNSLIIEWNKSIDFPDWMSGFEVWAQQSEAKVERLTNFLTDFGSIQQFLIALLVIAVVPAVGEELLFRGLLQNLFYKGSGSAHVAIWFTAILFGVFHLQFYGVVPRILLGALFGYIYYWTGSLSLAMIGHFFNNAFTLILLYLSQTNIIEYDPLSEESPPISVIAVFLVGGSILLYLLRSNFAQTKNA